MTLDKLIRAVMKYMDERGMLNDMKKKYRTQPRSGTRRKKKKPGS